MGIVDSITEGLYIWIKILSVGLKFKQSIEKNISENIKMISWPNSSHIFYYYFPFSSNKLPWKFQLPIWEFLPTLFNFLKTKIYANMTLGIHLSYCIRRLYAKIKKFLQRVDERSKVLKNQDRELINPFMPTGAFNICCPRDCVSRHNGGPSGDSLTPSELIVLSEHYRLWGV